MNLTLALLAVTAAIPVSLQPHSVKFYSFLVVAARPQPCRGGWRGESPALRKLEAREAKWGTAARWDMPGSRGAARSLRGLLQAGMSCAWGGTVLHVGTQSIAAVTPSRGGSGPALPVCCGAVVGRCHPSPGVGHMPGDRAEPLASQPRWVRVGPHGETRRSSETAPNENQLYICFVSAQRCSGPQGDEECG